VRVTATRLVVDLARKAPGEVPRTDEELARRLPPSADPELELLQRNLGAALPEAFEAGLARLTARQRNLLRQRYLHEITVERLATMYEVHRSTMFEWLGKARADLLNHVREALAARIPDRELESVVGVLGSKLHVSVRRMLDSKLEDAV
jgi:RNA polymerase sigma-70 factor (ECF subfamily)